MVQGCALTIPAMDFPALLDSYRPMHERAVTTIQSELEMPKVGQPFPIARVYYTWPPEDWGINTHLIYTDASHTRIVVYLRQLMVVN